jgi:Cd2+/Zn2+-exporting ATPase
VVSGVKVAGELAGGSPQEAEEGRRELLRVAATIEQRSSHPLARSIVAYAKGLGVHPSEAADVEVLDGLGVRARVDGKMAVAGSAKIVPADHVGMMGKLDDADETLPVVPVYVVVEGRLLGAIELTDEIRPEAARTIQRLRGLGIRKVAMLTGDRRRTAELVGRAVGCDEVFAELLPAQKVELVRNLQRGGKGVCMVGDGINDAPSLAAATVGVAMGVRGTDVAIEAADAVLLKDDLTRVALLIYLAKRTRTAIYQNLVFSLVFAGAAEAAVALGLLNIFGKGAPAMAALVHLAGIVMIALNSVRLAGGGYRKTAPAAEEPHDDEGTLRRIEEKEEAVAALPRFTPMSMGVD